MSSLPRTPEGSIDWDAVRDRLRLNQTTTDSEAMSGERARAILDARARVLATPPIAPMEVDDYLEVMTFGLGPERYAIETKHVREVIRLVDFTPVPGAPDFVVGVINHRGRILCVVDLRRFFRTSANALTDSSRVIVIGVETAEFGILAERTEAIAALPASALVPSPPSLAGSARQYLIGVTRDAQLVLDGARLLQDPRLFVDQQETGQDQDES